MSSSWRRQTPWRQCRRGRVFYTISPAREQRQTHWFNISTEVRTSLISGERIALDVSFVSSTFKHFLFLKRLRIVAEVDQKHKRGAADLIKSVAYTRSLFLQYLEVFSDPGHGENSNSPAEGALEYVDKAAEGVGEDDAGGLAARAQARIPEAGRV